MPYIPVTLSTHLDSFFHQVPAQTRVTLSVSAQYPAAPFPCPIEIFRFRFAVRFKGRECPLLQARVACRPQSEVLYIRQRSGL